MNWKALWNRTSESHRVKRKMTGISQKMAKQINSKERETDCCVCVCARVGVYTHSCLTERVKWLDLDRCIPLQCETYFSVLSLYPESAWSSPPLFSWEYGQRALQHMTRKWQCVSQYTAKDTLLITVNIINTQTASSMAKQDAVWSQRLNNREKHLCLATAAPLAIWNMLQYIVRKSKYINHWNRCCPGY